MGRRKQGDVIGLTEYDKHKTIVDFLTLQHIPFYHIPNGGKKNTIIVERRGKFISICPEGNKLKKLGVKAGVPDLCIVKSCAGYNGCYIEVKNDYGNSLSPAQVIWKGILEEENYHYINGSFKKLDDILGEIKDYLNGSGRSSDNMHSVCCFDFVYIAYGENGGHFYCERCGLPCRVITDQIKQVVGLETNVTQRAA